MAVGSRTKHVGVMLAWSEKAGIRIGMRAMGDRRYSHAESAALLDIGLTNDACAALVDFEREVTSFNLTFHAHLHGTAAVRDFRAAEQ